MKKMLVFQISLLIVFAGALGGMVAVTDVYDDVQTSIVSLICLSCIKLSTVSSANFTFETANEKPHPDFVLENLTKGPVFLTFRTNVCDYCDDMEPLLMDIFGLEFEKQDVFYETVSFKNSNVTFIHINKDHSSVVLRESHDIYDVRGDRSVPMFVMITYGYDRGIIKPYYYTEYGIIDITFTDEQRIQEFERIISNGIDLYNEFSIGFEHPHH